MRGSGELGMSDWRDHPGLRMMYDSILQLDEPDHGRLRALVSKVFTARRSGGPAGERARDRRPADR